jgi:hypothetical protein
MITRFRISPSWIFVMPAVLLGMTLEHRSGAAETPCPVGAPAEITTRQTRTWSGSTLPCLEGPRSKSTWRPMC